MSMRANFSSCRQDFNDFPHTPTSLHFTHARSLVVVVIQERKNVRSDLVLYGYWIQFLSHLSLLSYSSKKRKKGVRQSCARMKWGFGSSKDEQRIETRLFPIYARSEPSSLDSHSFYLSLYPLYVQRDRCMHGKHEFLIMQYIYHRKEARGPARNEIYWQFLCLFNLYRWRAAAVYVAHLPAFMTSSFPTPTRSERSISNAHQLLPPTDIRTSDVECFHVARISFDWHEYRSDTHKHLAFVGILSKHLGWAWGRTKTHKTAATDHSTLACVTILINWFVLTKINDAFSAAMSDCEAFTCSPLAGIRQN